MASDFTMIGFASSTDDLKVLAAVTVDRGRRVDSPMGRYFVWPPSPGEQLWVQVIDGSIVGLNPHFDGPSRLRAAIVESLRDPEYPMEGSILCWANPRGDDPESGEYPLIVDVPDFDASVSGLQLPLIADLQVAAFARGLTCWSTDADYRTVQRERWGEGNVKGFAPESFVPSGMFDIDEGRNRPMSGVATATFTGHVVSAQLRSNAYSGLRYWHVHTKTLGGEYDVVADPEVVAGVPQVGGIVQGVFWLTGRLASR